MNRPFPFLLVAVVILMPLVALAESCPPTLPQDALTVRAPAGWHGYSPSSMRLTGFGMMGGDPQSMAYLVPVASSKTKTGGRITWTHPELWLCCTYDDSAAIQISKRLHGKTCTASYKEKDRVIVDMQVECSQSVPPARR